MKTGRASGSKSTLGARTDRLTLCRHEVRESKAALLGCGPEPSGESDAEGVGFRPRGVQQEALHQPMRCGSFRT